MDFLNEHLDCVVNIVEETFSGSGKFNLVTISYKNGDEVSEVADFVIKDLMDAEVGWSLQIITEATKNLLESEPKINSNYAMLFATNNSIFSNLLDVLTKFSCVSSSTFFIVYTKPSSNKTSILTELWKRNLKRLIILSEENERSVSVHGLYLDNKQGQDCFSKPKLILMDKCAKGKRAKATIGVEDFNRLLPLKPDLSNCSMNVIAMIYPPYVVNDHEGLDISILHAMERYFNFTMNIVLDNHSAGWYLLDQKGQYRGKLQQILKNHAFGIGNVRSNPMLEKDFSLSLAYVNEKLVWVVPIANSVPTWKLIFIVFEYPLWLLILAVFLVSAMLFCLFARKNQRDKALKSISNSVMVSAQILLANVATYRPRSALMRFMFMSLVCFSMFATTLYQNSLINFLTSEIYEYQIQSFEEILDNDMIIGGIESNRAIFDNEFEGNFRKIYEKYVVLQGFEDSTDNWIRIVGDDRKAATLSARAYVQYLIAKNDSAACQPNGAPKVYAMNKILFEYPIRMILPKEHVLREQVDFCLNYFITYGFVKLWSEKYLREMEKSEALLKDSRDKSDEDIQLTLLHTSGAFFLLFFGQLVSFLALLAEKVYYQYARRRIRNNWKRAYQRMQRIRRLF